ncbi:MAG: hypothetical protein RL417_605, partial [Pseudomonadota bacterium]
MSKRRPSSTRKKSQKSLAKDLTSLTQGGLLDEALALAFLALAVFLCISFISFEVGRGSEPGTAANILGPLGHFTGTMLSGFFGWCALVPVLWALIRAVYWWGHDEREAKGSGSEPISVRGVVTGLVGLICVIVGAATVGAVLFGAPGGGVVGEFVARPLVRLGNTTGAIIVAVAFLLFSLSLASRLSVVELVARAARVIQSVARFSLVLFPVGLLKGLGYLHRSVGSGMRGISARAAEVRRAEPKEEEPRRRPSRERALEPVSAADDGVPVGVKVKAKAALESGVDGTVPELKSGGDDSAKEEGSSAQGSEEGFSHVVVKRREVGEKRVEVKKVRKSEVVEPEEAPSNYPPYELPDVGLLTRGEPAVGSENDEELLDKSRQIESKLRDFSIHGKVTQVHPGPVITLFEFEPAPGVKVGKIAALQDDLAMSLRASSIRIIAPIPKRGTVGIEVPNKHRDIVRLRDCLESEAFVSGDSSLCVAIGKDTYGDPVVVDIATMPHLLMAGATGTGKSVCINTLLLSLLYRASPEELGLILIDPKILELSIYEDIPHLRVPVVTVPRQAKAVLDWAVNEMNRRYRLMQKFGVRNIDGYNRVVRGDDPPDGEVAAVTDVIELSEAEVVEGGTVEPPHPVEAEGDADRVEVVEKLEPLPKIVIVIDELADLMLTVGRDIEELITRLAQKARAS